MLRFSKRNCLNNRGEPQESQGIWARRAGKDRPPGYGADRALPAVMVYSALAVAALLVLVPNPLRAYCHNGMLSPLWMMILVGLSRDRSVLARALAAGPLVLLGEISYGMYILQRPIFGFAVELFRRYPGQPNVTVRFLIYLALLFLVSWACHRWIEQPAREAVRYRHAKSAEGTAR